LSTGSATLSSPFSGWGHAEVIEESVVAVDSDGVVVDAETDPEEKSRLGDRVEFNHGATVTDLMGNTLKAGNLSFDAPLQFAPAELHIGKKWTAAFVRNDRGQVSSAFYDLNIVSRERVAVPAGEFDTFRIEGRGWNKTFGARVEVNFWLVPGLIFPVKREWITRNRRGHFTNTERHELVSLQQQAIGL